MSECIRSCHRQAGFSSLKSLIGLHYKGIWKEKQHAGKDFDFLVCVLLKWLIVCVYSCGAGAIIQTEALRAAPFFLVCVTQTTHTNAGTCIS